LWRICSRLAAGEADGCAVGGSQRKIDRAIASYERGYIHGRPYASAECTRRTCWTADRGRVVVVDGRLGPGVVHDSIDRISGA